ncbi:MAG: serine/threonine protein kinase, partial [Deltaproteobacteria bacterium]|nr:serine/threonine protein kinase [Deltaproteobacteria bacterium]
MTDDSTMLSREARGPAYGPGWTNAATLVDASPAPPRRERLGRYELIAPLGAGGMGEVFLAELCGPHAFRKRFAIKRLLPSLESDPVAVSRFAREAQLAARLTHPAICQAFELGYDAGAHYIVMEYLDGTTLGRVLTQLRGSGTALPLPVVARIVDRVCAGLAAAHALRDDLGANLGLVHRDVSPSNIAITRGGEVKLLDFGVAKVDQVRTESGVLRGKFGYMSPEQIMNKPIDRRTDVFAVGVVLFEALTGRRLFGQPEPRAIAEAILRSDVPDVRALRPDLPASVGAVVARALARRRGERFASAEQLRRALLAAIAPATPAGPRALAKLAGWSADTRSGDAPTMVALALP